jgi:hypothetical protein
MKFPVDEPDMPGKPNEGWAKIAFTTAFKYLREEMSYTDAMST